MLHCTEAQKARSLVQKFYAVVLDDGVAEYVARDLIELMPRALAVRAAPDGDFEVFALPYVFDFRVAETVQRRVNGLPLRIEDRRLERDVDAGFHRYSF